MKGVTFMKTRSIISLSIFLFLVSSVLFVYAGAINAPPTGFLDSVKYQNGRFLASGWAADKEDNAPVKKVMVYIDGKFIGDARLGSIRSDVAETLKHPDWKKSGWDISKSVSLKKGPHEVFVVVIDKQGGKTTLNKVKLTVE